MRRPVFALEISKQEQSFSKASKLAGRIDDATAIFCVLTGLPCGERTLIGGYGHDMERSLDEDREKVRLIRGRKRSGVMAACLCPTRVGPPTTTYFTVRPSAPQLLPPLPLVLLGYPHSLTTIAANVGIWDPIRSHCCYIECRSN